MASWAKKLYKSSNRPRLLLPPPLNLHPSHDDSSTLSQVQEVVLAADLRCTTCQKRVNDVISSIDDIESMVVHVGEKKVVLTPKIMVKGSSTKVAAVYNNLSAGRFSMVALSPTV